MKPLIALAGAALLLTGCSAAATAPVASTPPATPLPPTTLMPTPTASPPPAAPTSTTPSPKPSSELLKFGEEGTTPTATFLFSQRKVVDPKKRHVQSFMLRGCLKAGSESTHFSSQFWTAIGPDGERYRPAEWTDIQPGFTYEMPVKPGECVKGWLQFETQDKLVELRYQNDAGARLGFEVPQS